MTENKEHNRVILSRDHYRRQLEDEMKAQRDYMDEMEAQRDYMDAVTRVMTEHDFRPGTRKSTEEKVRNKLEWLVTCRQCTWEALRELREVELAYDLHQKENKDK